MRTLGGTYDNIDSDRTVIRHELGCGKRRLPVSRPRREEALVDAIGDAAIWPCAGGARIDLPASSLPNDAGHAMDAAAGLLFVDDVVTSGLSLSSRTMRGRRH